MSFRREKHNKTANENNSKPETKKRKKKKTKDVVGILSELQLQPEEEVHLQLNRCTGFIHDDSFDLDEYVQKIELLQNVYPKLTYTIVAYLNPHDPEKCEAFLKANAKTIEKLGENFCIDDVWRQKNRKAVEDADNSVKKKLPPGDIDKFNNLLKERAQKFAKKYEVSVEVAIMHLRKETIDTLALLQPASENLSRLTILYYDHDLPDVMNFLLGARTEILEYHRDSFVHAQTFDTSKLSLKAVPASLGNSNHDSNRTQSNSPRSRVHTPETRNSPTLPKSYQSPQSSIEEKEEKEKASTPPNNHTPNRTPKPPRRRLSDPSLSLFPLPTKSQPKTSKDINDLTFLLKFGVQLAQAEVPPAYLVGFLLEAKKHTNVEPWINDEIYLPEQSENVTTTLLMSNDKSQARLQSDVSHIPVTSTQFGMFKKAQAVPSEASSLSTSPGFKMTVADG